MTSAIAVAVIGPSIQLPADRRSPNADRSPATILTVFRKVLIANRGEIAVRIIRTLREMNIRTVAVYSDADRASLHVRKADEAAHIGPAPSRQSYLNIGRIMDVARRHGADAIHPGYGFLSENADFAAACENAGITSSSGRLPRTIRQMGSKTGARQIAAAAGAPIVPGVHRAPWNLRRPASSHVRHGYPVMLKAVAGGGGKGMRRVDHEADLEASFRDASSEALRAFGDGAIYVEKLIERPRHIEIQVFGDTTATWSTSASANAPSSDGTRRSLRNVLRH